MAVLLYHRDFDGMASAGIALRFTQDAFGLRFSEYRSVDYSDGNSWYPGWPDAAHQQPFAVVDFQYHPYALLWADHHPTAFPAQSIGSFAERLSAGDAVCWDRAQPSCAAVLARWAQGSEVWPNVLRAANKIDQAAYESVEEIFTSDAPEICINRINHELIETERTKIIDALAEDDLESAAWLVREKSREQKKLQWRQLQAAATAVTRIGRVAVLDGIASNLGFVRFAPLYYYPDADYQAHVYSTGSGVGLSISINNWGGQDRIHLGNWLRHHGGGGHAKAAGCQISSNAAPSAYAKCWEVLHQLISTINAT